MKKIKFRGKDENNGNYVYGDLCSISSVISTPSIINEHGNRIFVDPDTVAQFIGYDMNGEEVYDNDTLISYEEIAVEATEALMKWDFGDTFKDYVLWK